ncbi:MAG: class I SAM-dependent methyltransferase [Alphaproteobacteria bacterium]
MKTTTVAETLNELIEPGPTRILDIGCGDGSNVRLLAARGAQVTGLEVSAARIADARAKPKAGEETYLEASAESLPLPDASMDVVAFINSLHHVPADAHAAALDEARRVLVPGGRMIVFEPLAEGPNFEVALSFDDETEIRAKAYAAVCRAATDGFRQTEERVFLSATVVRDFDAFVDRRVKTDPARRERVARVIDRLRADFERLAKRTSEGYLLEQPFRVNVLEKLG